MSKTRIVVNCPETGILAIAAFSCEDLMEPAKRPRFFNCPCGEVHKLDFAGWRNTRPAHPLGNHRAS